MNDLALLLKTKATEEGRQAGKSGNTRNISRVLVFKLGGKASLPPVGPALQRMPPLPPDTADAAIVAARAQLGLQAPKQPDEAKPEP